MLISLFLCLLVFRMAKKQIVVSTIPAPAGDPVQPQTAVSTNPAPASDPVQPQIAVSTSPAPAGDPVQPQIAVSTNPAPAGDPVQPQIAMSTNPAPASDPVQPQIAVSTNPAPASDPVQPQIAMSTSPAPAGDPVQPQIPMSTIPAAAGDPVQQGESTDASAPRTDDTGRRTVDLEAAGVVNSSSVCLQSNGTPSKIKRGVPHWYAGKVSPAFANHIFWPSPPKKKQQKSSRQVQLFPACASSRVWRRMHEEKAQQSSDKIQPKKRQAIATGNVTAKKRQKKAVHTETASNTNPDNAATTVLHADVARSNQKSRSKKTKTATKGIVGELSLF